MQKFSMLKVHSKVDSIVSVEDYLNTVFDMFQIPTEKYGDILISLTEAVNNAMIHGNALDENKLVCIHHKLKDKRIYFYIQDEGCGFDIDLIPDPTCKENIEETGGRGVRIMLALADHLCYNIKGKYLEIGFNL
jgi:serine/threonine-protein kinase RsbW